jgi:mercuric reductase
VIRPGAVLIATGAPRRPPPITGLAQAGYLTSTAALNLKQVPERLAVTGTNAFEEPEVSQALTDVLRGQGAPIHTPAPVVAVERDGDMRRIRATVRWRGDRHGR